VGRQLAWPKYAHESDCPLMWKVFYCAATYGHPDVLAWARANGGGSGPWNPRVCARAAEIGHLDVLTWALANDCRCYGKYH
jgi:hypothetical protein